MSVAVHMTRIFAKQRLELF